MMRKSSAPGSMDMLLDTMCNTFGGVCFIALMVAILSAALPKESEDAKTERVTESRIMAKEILHLQAQRDVLLQAIDIHRSFVEKASTGVVVKADLAKIACDIAGSAEKIRLYEKKRVEYMDELAKVKTRTAYSRREAARLARMLKEMEDKVGRPIFDRHRAVRTPRERELQGLKMIDVWLHERRLYMMDDGLNIREEATGELDGKKLFDLHLVKGRGVLLDDGFFENGRIWPKLQQRLDSNSYVRIFTDTVSFDELCLLRDALISRGAMYNWIVNEEDVIHFIEGYDGHVQ